MAKAKVKDAKLDKAQRKAFKEYLKAKGAKAKDIDALILDEGDETAEQIADTLKAWLRERPKA